MKESKKDIFVKIIGLPLVIIIIASFVILIWNVISWFHTGQLVNTYLFFGSIMVLAIIGLVVFFVEIYEDSAYHRRKTAKIIHKWTKPQITEDSGAALFCPNCGQKLLSMNSSFCANCGYEFKKD